MNYTEPFAKKNRQIGQMCSQPGTCSTPGTGKEMASGDSCWGTTACSLLLLPSPPVLLLLLIPLHLSSPVFSHQHRPERGAWTSSAAAFQPSIPSLHSPRSVCVGRDMKIIEFQLGLRLAHLPAVSSFTRRNPKSRVSCRESPLLTLLC